ncbi:LPXTG cell wall anchor domain-containing protein [Micromonospora sp. DR5-3]|uniref:LPXTG cell wall anchor domain-containing protein n=1 Tax=unclassified Micromonospora TaxID=2617518 RepID=UPI0011D67473|nr:MULTISPECIES: LPXTG cell wall anchor domain-containing protein [unclassified Micromonospora]MCW3813242.1 LPXTG cell wall anchor domain-containing protein [Micromonospora sp. DR5-3]TYC24635.1 LPXTG cell wall anchor domain-containing protein [Micromonospora sp. MP36]
MPERRHVARAALTAAAATACLAFAAPAWAATGNPHNPPGDNGTVKIDGMPFTDHVDNQPHVTCEFELEFFNFDQNQRANITLWAQPPSATPKDKVVWSKKDVLISNDPASGAENDHDEVIRLSANDLDLTGLKLQPKQGYHIKLDVELIGGKSSDGKHKVFWLQPCASSETPTPNPSNPGGESPNPGGSENPSEAPSPGTSVGGGSGGGSGSLPITGVAATSMALTGLALIVGGVVLTALRRRRDKITFTS